MIRFADNACKVLVRTVYPDQTEFYALSAIPVLISNERSNEEFVLHALKVELPTKGTGKTRKGAPRDLFVYM